MPPAIRPSTTWLNSLNPWYGLMGDASMATTVGSAVAGRNRPERMCPTPPSASVRPRTQRLLPKTWRAATGAGPGVDALVDRHRGVAHLFVLQPVGQALELDQRRIEGRWRLVQQPAAAAGCPPATRQWQAQCTRSPGGQVPGRVVVVRDVDHVLRQWPGRVAHPDPKQAAMRLCRRVRSGLRGPSDPTDSRASATVRWVACRRFPTDGRLRGWC